MVKPRSTTVSAHSSKDFSPEQRRQMLSLHDGGLTFLEIAKRFGISERRTRGFIADARKASGGPAFTREFFQRAGERGGAIGGPISRTKMSKERASEIARAAAAARTTNPQRLTAKDIPGIFADYSNGVPVADIAKEKGVASFTIHAIIYRRIWKHVEITPEILLLAGQRQRINVSKKREKLQKAQTAMRKRLKKAAKK